MMKIVVGLGSVDDYPAFVKAGADEFYAGYVPARWAFRYPQIPLNRREVCYSNVQIGARSELELLKGLEEKYGVPVAIAMNGLAFSEELYPEIYEIMQECMEIGFSSFILADPGLIYYLHECSAELAAGKLKIHVSGEIGEPNLFVAEWLAQMTGASSRLIFHRQVSISEMQQLIEANPGFAEYEAFILNERCHYTGAYCNSLHCDRLLHACEVPWEIARRESLLKSLSGAADDSDHPELLTSKKDHTGIGCGLCQLRNLQEIGVTHIKIVSRGNFAEDTIRDIELVKKALKKSNQVVFAADSCAIVDGECYFHKSIHRIGRH